MRAFFIAVLLGVICASPAAAHPSPFSYIDVRLPGAAVDLTVVAHIFDVAHDLDIQDEKGLLDPTAVAGRREAIVALLGRRIHVWVDGREVTGAVWSAPELLADREAIQLKVHFELPAAPSRLLLAVSLFPYDPVHQTFVNIYERDAVVLQAILGRDRHQVEFFPGTTQGTLAVMRRFAAAGVHHILIGPDHLLFLIGLMLFGGSLRQLVLVVSAFTVAHSITLSLAVFRILAPPAWLIEPAIALSIVYVGADNLTVRGGRDMRAWIAFAFGLIHGFGFASVLREMELPPRALGWSLLSFNLGVEAGQLLVVVPVASALALIRARSERVGRQLAVAGSVVVIAAGAFWFVQRVWF